MRFLLSISFWAVLGCGTAPADDTRDAEPAYAHDLASLSDSCAGDPTLTGARALAIIGSPATMTYAPKDGTPPTTLSISITPSSPLAIRCEPAAPAGIRLLVTAIVSSEDGTFANDSFVGELDLSSDASQPPLAMLLKAPVASLAGTYTPHFALTTNPSLALAAYVPPVQGWAMEDSNDDFAFVAQLE